MPLVLPKVEELIQDRRIVWNANRLKEVDEAKAIIMAYKRQGYKILRINGEVMQNFRPHYEEVLIKAEKIEGHIMKILSESGDDRLTWDKEDGHAAKAAKLQFEKLIGQGYKAYSVDASGNKKRRIHEFDVDAEEILMIPKTVRG